MDGNGRWAEQRGLPWRRPPSRHAGVASHGRSGDRLRRRVARRLCVLDRELDASGRRGGRPDGDLRQETIGAGSPTSRGKACVRFVGRRDGRRRFCSGRWRRFERHRREHPPPALDLLRLRRSARRWSRPCSESWRAASVRTPSTRLIASSLAAPDADLTCWSRRPAGCGSRTSLLWQLAYAEARFHGDALARLRPC